MQRKQKDKWGEENLTGSVQTKVHLNPNPLKSFKKIQIKLSSVNPNATHKFKNRKSNVNPICNMKIESKYHQKEVQCPSPDTDMFQA